MYKRWLGSWGCGGPWRGCGEGFVSWKVGLVFFLHLFLGRMIDRLGEMNFHLFLGRIKDSLGRGDELPSFFRKDD
jgi:hypothetical protein